MDAKKKILSKLEEMNRYLGELEDILPEKEREYLRDLTIRRACEKTVESAIEAVISIISIVVSSNKLGLPQSEDDLIDTIEKKKILSQETAEKIRQMKGFRNILVHKYGEIDDALSYQFLTEEIDDFSQFEKEIKACLASQQL